MDSILKLLSSAALAGVTDQDLVDALVTRCDQASFEALLLRHGPMVLAVCRRVLRHAQDAEDAFQATFLVLLRKAAAVRKREAIGSWLYGVAYRTARKAQVMNTRRRVGEMQAAARPRRQTPEPDADLDEELSALPEKYRAPVVLCQLEGRSRKEVARQLNIPEGTLSSRLATAHKTLARRLRRRGWTSSGVVPVAGGVPARLVTASARSAELFLASQGITGVVSTKVIALSEGVVKAMFVNKLTVLTVVLVAVAALGVGTGQLAYLALAQGPATTQEQPNSAADRVQRAAAELAAAQAALKQAEANLAAAQTQVARKETEYQNALQHTTRPGENAGPSAGVLASRFPYRVPVEIGWTENKDGGRIEILEVRGTRPRIEIGGQYLVHGKYTLPSRERGRLYFHRTSTGSDGTSYDLDLQWTSVQKGQGEFTLLHGMSGPGYFHLHLVGPNEQQYDTVANVYFGTGDNVWRKK
jgi:RNA polymerase sigma factor (sigma-70 family)